MNAIRLKLTRYFDALPHSARQIEELPWLLAGAARWPELTALLCDDEFLAAGFVCRPVGRARSLAAD